jgi:superfamily I DNA/RNA helicase
LKAELIYGPPGCGKTFFMIEKVKEALARGVHPDKIGYVSFTVKAVEEAVARVGKEFGLTKKDCPFFKTLHALCFRMLGLTRNDVVNGEDYYNLGRLLGMAFKEGSAVDLNDDWTMPGEVFDDPYLRMYDRARLRCISLEQEFRETASYVMSYPVLTRTAGTWENYKQAKGRLDFTDMLAQFLAIGEVPRLELLIVDEAQDLTPLQWAVVRKLMERADEVYFAGDDDQAIHAWAGVDIKLFLNASDNQRVLQQSFRLPRSVHTLAETVVKRIDVRKSKLWFPTDREGSVQFHMDRHTVPLDQGSWTIMARTNFQVNELSREMREDGVFYSRGSQRSVSVELATALDAWDRLAKGQTLSKDEAKALMKRLPKTGRKQALKANAMAALETGDPEGRYSLELLRSDYGLLIEEGGVEIFGLSYDDEVYIRSLLRRGTNLMEEPKIKLSTIHKMKGGEDDNIMLLTDSTRACTTSPDQDNEHRTIYVGITRAKENLHVIESSRKYRYTI